MQLQRRETLTGMNHEERESESGSHRLDIDIRIIRFKKVVFLRDGSNHRIIWCQGDSMSGITVEPANGTLSPGENMTLALPWPQLEFLQSHSCFQDYINIMFCQVDSYSV